MDARLQEASGAFADIKTKFEAIAAERMSKLAEMDQSVRGKLADADTEFKSFQTQLSADMLKASDLF